MKKYLGILEQIGLSKNSGLIYLSLLEHGKSSITDITTNTGLHRVQIYRLLPYLIETEFVLVTTKGKKKYYLPANPSKINDAYQDLQERNKGSINKLVEKYSNLEKKPNVIYSEGAKSITNVFNDIVDSLDKGDVFYRITSETDVERINETYLPKDYRVKRDKKELERYVIMSSNAAIKKQQRLERELKIIPEKLDEFKDNVLMTIYGHKVGFIDFNTETSIIIESKEIADFQKKLFKLLYRSL